jgi:uncharacterized protein (TIGR02996 family)
MTDEEPFIRAIVDSPGDETPRLVYADWLEERGDPRAPYLRAEHEVPKRFPMYADWERPDGKVRLLAKQLDVVWCARVSRPPIGVCCEHVQIRDRGPVITAQDIERFEQKVGVILPHDYRAFLLNYNGGVVGGGDREPPQFHSLAPPPETGEEGWLKQWCAFRHEQIAQYEQIAQLPQLPDYVDYVINALHCHRESLARSLEIGRTQHWGILLVGWPGPELEELLLFGYREGFTPTMFERIGDPLTIARYLARCT